MKKSLLFFGLVILIFSSCSFEFLTGIRYVTSSFTTIDCPTEIISRAFKFAELYEKEDTVYEWGGEDPLRNTIGIDCSGLVIMCYKYAMVDTEYKLLNEDMTAQNIHDYASTKKSVGTVQKGDLVFIGPEGSKEITHIGFFEKYEDNIVYILDSSSDSNGVHYNSYSVDSKKIKGYGRMRVKY
ncbi:MAG: C40 family peptidase [Spirochaetaceae bacterium]|nr:C40 family peptidase [Spirochaetaceae bacterium]